jgi:tight adherence protein C
MTAFISVLFAVIVFSLLLIIFNKFGLDYDRVKTRLYALANDDKKEILDDELNKPLSERFITPILDSIVKLLAKFLPETSDDNQKSENLRKMLRQAGMTLMPSEYSAIRLIVIAGCAVLFLVIGIVLKLSKLYVIVMPLFGAYAAFVVLRFNLMSRISSRRESMERQLPDVLDMLSVNVEAGLGFEQAMLHIIEHFEGPLIDEFNIAYREMSMGRSRKDALTLLGDRCDIEDLKSFTGSVIQAAKLGISLKNVLHTQADAIRTSRRSQIEEKAHKMSIKILIPMLLFIFPVIFIVLLGPAVVSIMEVFGGGF